MLSALLKPFSLNVVHATTADEAKRLFRSLRPELTIIGLIEDWIPLLDVLRSGSSHVGVIVLTESDGLAASVRNMGFENVLIEQDPETVVEGIHCFLGDWFATSAPAPMKGATVLIVHDDEEFPSSLSVDLAMRGYTVALAETGKVALEYWNGIRRSPWYCWTL